MTHLPPLRPHHWTLPRHERRWYHPMRDVGRHGPRRPKHSLTVYAVTQQVLIARHYYTAQVDAVHHLPYGDARAARRHLRAYLRRIGLPGRTIREVCGGVHRSGRCWVTPCTSAAWHAAMALRGAP